MTDPNIDGESAGLADLRSVLSEVGEKPVEVVSDTFAANGLVRLVVRSDASITVEVDPYAAGEVPVSDIERHLTDLFRDAKKPKPQAPKSNTEKDEKVQAQQRSAMIERLRRL
ncbi:hypothetical protein [Glycomyces xiaoerkulensis]|uniref:hypothetical protein n=1 Tax=Glycomyces xiaoerkulensis TaxID=2038139 RepID=UPI0012FFF8FD|nr:hypothetical protein [Glycomyces xiaoerkulensis]